MIKKSIKKITIGHLVVIIFFGWLLETGYTYRHTEKSCNYESGQGLKGQSPSITLVGDAPLSFIKWFSMRSGGVKFGSYPYTSATSVEDVIMLSFDYDSDRNAGRLTFYNFFAKSGNFDVEYYGWFSPECWQKVAAFRNQALPHVRLLTRNWPKDLEPIPVWKDDKNPFDIPVYDQAYRSIKDPELFE